MESILSNSLQQADEKCNFSEITQHEHDYDSINIVWWSNVVILPLIACIGLSCNLLNISVLTTNTAARRIPSWNLLLALAVCDCFFLLFAILDVTPMSIPSLAFSSDFNYFYTKYVLIIRTLASTFYKSSVLIVVAFNMERYTCVVHPLNSHRWCTNKMSRNAILISISLSFLCSLQWPIAYDVKPCYEDISGQYYYIILMSQSVILRIYYRIMDYVSLFAFNALPIAGLLFMNTKIILTLRHVTKDDVQRDEEVKLSGTLIHQEHRSNRTLRANAMLFAVAIMLLICVGPQAPARILFDIYGQYHTKAILYTCISQQLVFLNASLNFFLYCVVSKRYRSLMRQTAKKMFNFIQGVDKPFHLNLKQTKSSSAHVTTLDDQQHIRLSQIS